MRFMTRTFRCIRQRDSMQCGVAALAMICAYHGQRYDLEWLEELCPPTPEGVSLKGISDAACKLGLNSVAAKLTPERLLEMPLPCILHWRQNHFVVLYRISRDRKRFYVADPAKGKVVYSKEELTDGWIPEGMDTGIAMMFEPSETFGSIKTESSGDPRSLGMMLSYIHRYRHLFIQIGLGLILASALQLVLPFLTQAIVDTGIVYKDINFIWLVLLGEMMILAGRTVTDFIRRHLLLHISMRINISLVSDFIIKLMRLPMSFFDRRLSGDIMQRMADHERVQQFLTGETLNAFFSAISMLVFGVVLFLYSPLIFGVYIGFSIAYAGWISLFKNRRRLLDYETFDIQAKNQNRIWQLITTMQEIKLQDCGPRRRLEWEDLQGDLFDVRMKSLRLTQIQETGSLFLTESRNVLVTVLAATAVINGSLTLGGMLALQYIAGQLGTPIQQLIGLILSLQDVKISLERINEVHRRKDENSGRHSTVPKVELTPQLTLKDVDFRYDRTAYCKTLDNVSVHIPAGKVTAIVGASGSGKSTLVRLLLGYYEPESGFIMVGDRDLKDLDLNWWRRLCGTVMQDGVIFSDSILHNIAVSDEKPDMKRIRTAARIACIEEYIDKLPLVYATKIGPDGVSLSQGQKQRILIARAVYRDPAFIILDEATNSLDTCNEKEITSNLSEFFRGRTVVIVAHRLSTIRYADHIVVLDKGRVVETGNHESLMSLKGHYHSLINSQLTL